MILVPIEYTHEKAAEQQRRIKAKERTKRSSAGERGTG